MASAFSATMSRPVADEVARPVEPGLVRGDEGVYAGSPFVAIASNLPKDRIRFTLLHELAHILGWRKDQGQRGDNERACHAFASEFLLPEDVLRKELSERSSEDPEGYQGLLKQTRRAFRK